MELQVTVIIPTYNGPDWLSRTLRCLCHQDVDPKAFEVIVCDDGSSDNTKEVACSFDSRLDLRYCYQPDRGFRAGTARNMGIRLARQEICAFVDTGVIVGEDFIRSVVDFHRRHRRAACIGIVHGSKMRDGTHPLVRYFRQISISEHPEQCLKSPMLRAYPDARQPIFDLWGHDLNRGSAPWSLYWTSLVTVETAVASEVGYFDEGFVGWGHEDIEFGYRLWKHGVRFYTDDRIRGLHLPHEQAAPPEATSKKNLAYFYSKHRELPVEMLQLDLPYGLDLVLPHLYMGVEMLPRDYETLDPGAFMPADGKTLLVGCLSPESAKRLQADAICAIGRETADRIREACPDATVEDRLGAVHPCGDKHYDVAVVTDIWRILPAELLSAMLNELDRVARRVFLFRSESLELGELPIPPAPRMPDGCGMETVWHRGDLTVYGLTIRREERPAGVPDVAGGQAIG